MFLFKSGQTMSLIATLLLLAGSASAHCDRLDGPVAVDALAALESGNFVTIAAWVSEHQTEELQKAFDQTRQVRVQSEAARELADRWFIETAVRLHRAAEGMPFTGLQPAGLPVEADVAAADRAYETGDIAPVIEMLHTALEGQVQPSFHQARETRAAEDGGLEAARARVDAYVRYVIYVHGLYETIQAGPAHGVGEDSPAGSTHTHTEHGEVMNTATYMQKTIGDLVTEQPSRARVFEDLGIDYCCGGNRSLEDACSTKGISPEAVIERLAAEDAARTTQPAFDYGAMSLTDLANDILDSHHVYVKRELPRLSQIVQKVALAHGDSPKADDLRHLVRVFDGLKGELEAHLMKEERMLFPAILRMDAGEEAMAVDGPISVMMHEHDSAGKALEEIRTLTDNFTLPEWGCNTYRAMLDGLYQFEQDLHIHIHKENNILFPRARTAARS